MHFDLIDKNFCTKLKHDLRGIDRNIAIFWNQWRADQANLDQYDHYFVLENGFCPHYQTVQISINSDLGPYSHWFQKDRPNFKDKSRFKVDRSKPFLICGQTPTDYSLLSKQLNPQQINYQQVIRAIKEETDNVVYRPHPLINRRMNWESEPQWQQEIQLCEDLGVEIDWNREGWSDVRWENWLGMITINSSAAIIAIMAGKPVISLGKSVYSLPGVSAQLDLSRWVGDCLAGDFLDEISPHTHPRYIRWLFKHQYPIWECGRFIREMIKNLP